MSPRVRPSADQRYSHRQCLQLAILLKVTVGTVYPDFQVLTVLERTGPTGGGPARSLLSVTVPCPHPHTFPACSGTGNLCLCPSVPFYSDRDAPLQPISAFKFARDTCQCVRSISPTLVEIPARAGQEPDASPRDTLTRATLSSQGLRRRRFAPFHTDRSTPLSCSARSRAGPHCQAAALLTAFHPRVGAGNVSRPQLRVGRRVLRTSTTGRTVTSGIGTDRPARRRPAALSPPGPGRARAAGAGHGGARDNWLMTTKRCRLPLKTGYFISRRIGPVGRARAGPPVGANLKN